MPSRILVLDANILIRAVLGNKVRDLLVKNNKNVDFFTPKVCFADAEKYLPILFEKKKITSKPALNVLSNIKNIVKIADEEIYKEYVTEVRKKG